MLGVWLGAAYSITARIQSTRQRAEAISDRYTNAQERLTIVNSQILLGSVYIRDALMESGTLSAQSRRSIEDTFQRISGAIDGYVPVLDSSPERDRLASLRREIDEFRDRMVIVLDMASVGSAAEARTLLRTQVVPKRQVVIGLSEDVRSLNRDAFVRHQAEVSQIYAASQRWLWGMLSTALIISFGIAIVATRYSRRLEQRLQQRAIADARNAADLERLSVKLISTQEEERRTIARELHDEVGQGLTAIKVELAVAERAIREAGVPGDVLGSARSIADGTLGTVRNLSHLLRPPMLDDQGLVDALRTHIERFGRRHEMLAHFEISGEIGTLSAEVETSIYRMIQEALTNVSRHAQATRCRVLLASTADGIRITVEDDGGGCDPVEAGQLAGLGLVGIRERTRQLGGTYEFRRNSGRGMALIVFLPAPWPGATGIESASAAGGAPAPSFAGAHE